MWGKHDEIREQMSRLYRDSRNSNLIKEDLMDAEEFLFMPILQTLTDMTKKEEDILFPMSLDVLTTEEWYEIHKQTMEFGFTLYDPEQTGNLKGSPQRMVLKALRCQQPELFSFHPEILAPEIMAILNTVPFDMTFVDKNDKVKYFTQGQHRIFTRNRSIINRDVRLCHPPGSVHIIEKILDDFLSNPEELTGLHSGYR